MGQNIVFRFNDQAVFTALNQAQFSAASQFEGRKFGYCRLGADYVAGAFFNYRGVILEGIDREAAGEREERQHSEN